MTGMSEPIGVLPAAVAEDRRDLSVRVRRSAEYSVIPLLALAISVVLFSLFLLAIGKSPVEFFSLVERGGAVRSVHVAENRRSPQRRPARRKQIIGRLVRPDRQILAAIIPDESVGNFFT